MQIQDTIDSVFSGEPHLIHSSSKNTIIRKKFTKNQGIKNQSSVSSKSKEQVKLQIFSSRKAKDPQEDNSFYKEFLEKITNERNEDKNFHINVLLDNDKDNSDTATTPKRSNPKIKVIQSPCKHRSNNISFGFNQNLPSTQFPHSGRPCGGGNSNKANNNNGNTLNINNNNLIKLNSMGGNYLNNSNNNGHIITPVLSTKEETTRQRSPVIRRKTSSNAIKKPGLLKREKSQNVLGICATKRACNLFGDNIICNNKEKEKEISCVPKEKQTAININTYLNGTNISSGSIKGCKDKTLPKHQINPTLTSIFETKVSQVQSENENKNENSINNENKIEMDYFPESKRIIDLNVNEIEIKGKKKLNVYNIASIWKKPNYLKIEKLTQGSLHGISPDINQNTNGNKEKDQNVINNIIIKSVVKKHKKRKASNPEVNQVNLYSNEKTMSLTPNHKQKNFCCF